MQYFEKWNPAKAMLERIESTKELIGPKKTLYLTQDSENGLIWSETAEESSTVLARGLAVLSENVSETGFLSVQVLGGSKSSFIAHMYRDYGATITEIKNSVSKEYHPVSEAFYTLRLIPIALLYGKAWKHIG